MQGHMHVSGNILPEVDDKISGGVAHEFSRKPFFFPHGDALVFDQFSFGMLGADRGFPPAEGGAAGVVNFAFLQVRVDDRSEADEPAFIRDDRLNAFVGVKQPQLAPERQRKAEIVVPAPPAVAHRHAQFVFAFP